MTYFSTNQSTGIFIFTCVIILNRFIPRYTPEIRVLTLSYHIPIQYYVACVNRKIGRKGHGTEKLLFFRLSVAQVAFYESGLDPRKPLSSLLHSILNKALYALLSHCQTDSQIDTSRRKFSKPELA